MSLRVGLRKWLAFEVERFRMGWNRLDPWFLKYELRPLIRFGWLEREWKASDVLLYDAMNRGNPQRWRVQSDEMYGGGTDAYISLPRPGKSGTALFEGDISLTPPDLRKLDKKYEAAHSGYATMFTRCKLNLEGVTAFVLRVRSPESRMFTFNLTCGNLGGLEGTALYQFDFVTPGDNQWTEVRMPVVAFSRVFNGKKMRNFFQPNINDVRAIGIMTKGPAGKFSVEVAGLDVDRDSDEEFAEGRFMSGQHLYKPAPVLSFAHRGVIRYRPWFVRTADKNELRKAESMYLPFAWAPERVLVLEKQWAAYGLDPLVTKELYGRIHPEEQPDEPPGSSQDTKAQEKGSDGGNDNPRKS